MNIYSKRISKLAERMKKQGIDAYIIPMNDDHGSEYVGDYYKCIEYFTGFTGSAGTLVVTSRRRQEKGLPAYTAQLWTDGRYFIQAEEELEGTGISLMKMGEPGVPKIPEFLQVKKKRFISMYLNKLNGEAPVGGTTEYTVALDGKLFTTPYVESLAKSINANKDGDAQIITDAELVNKVIDKDESFARAEMPHESIWELSPTFAGATRDEKIGALQAALKKHTNADGESADCIVLTDLAEIAWLFNLRGSDIDYNPVFLAYALVSRRDASLFLNTGEYPRRILTPAIYSNKKQMVVTEDDKVEGDINVFAYPYAEFFKAVKNVAKSGAVIMYDRSRASYAVSSTIEKHSKKKPLAMTSPILLTKAVKNPVEIENEKKAHLYDGVALTRLICWLKTKVRTGREKADELSVAEKLVKLRADQPHYVGESFAPIIAYAEHGAIVHYEADEKTNVPIGTENLLLMDTGGHYLEGTTDVTRTIVMNDAAHPVSEEVKRCYTAVLMGHLRLADAVFKFGTRGSSLDILAREPIFRIGQDFNHGTGHGVGYLLNVHEGPNNISMKRGGDMPLYAGMITSDEPGIYIEDKFGIRLENLELCENYDVPFEMTDGGTYLKFEPLTMVPFDHEAIDFSMMTEHDKELLKAYEEKVWINISPRLSREEREWLAKEMEY